MTGWNYDAATKFSPNFLLLKHKLSSSGSVHAVEMPYDWQLPSTVASILAHFLCPVSVPVSLLFFSIKVGHNNTQRVRDKSQTQLRAAIATDVSKKYHSRYQPQLYLPIFTRLMAMETGSGFCWCLGLADSGNSEAAHSQAGEKYQLCSAW